VKMAIGEATRRSQLRSGPLYAVTLRCNSCGGTFDLYERNAFKRRKAARLTEARHVKKSVHPAQRPDKLEGRAYAA
jgi:hypothetical protein